MDAQDKQLLKNSGTVAVDAGVAVIDVIVLGGLPGLTTAWNLAKGLYGNGIKFRQQRVLEFIQAIIDDPSTFNEQVVNSEEFQDGFVVALEDYIKLRHYLKRRIAMKIFKNFAESDDKIEFQLERFNDALDKISSSSLSTLAILKQSGLHEVPSIPRSSLLGMDDQIDELEYLGMIKEMVKDEHSSLVINSDDVAASFRMTTFGVAFIEFIESDQELDENSFVKDSE